MLTRVLARSDWNKVHAPAPEQITPYAELPKASDPSLLNKLAVLKLNGGLGTTMGW
jgi:UTP--glucose-1-phosphate uridylyltransferase